MGPRHLGRSEHRRRARELDARAQGEAFPRGDAVPILSARRRSDPLTAAERLRWKRNELVHAREDVVQVENVWREDLLSTETPQRVGDAAGLVPVEARPRVSHLGHLVGFTTWAPSCPSRAVGCRLQRVTRGGFHACTNGQCGSRRHEQHPDPAPSDTSGRTVPRTSSVSSRRNRRVLGCPGARCDDRVRRRVERVGRRLGPRPRAERSHVEGRRCAGFMGPRLCNRRCGQPYGGRWELPWGRWPEHSAGRRRRLRSRRRCPG